MTPFIHLHCHSEYSLSDSILRVPQLGQFAQSQAMPAIALTDRNNLFAALKFYQSARKLGVKPIIGCDLSVRDEDGHISQLVLLVQNHEGFRHLCQLLSHLYLDDQRRHELAVNMDRLTPASCAGLIALSGGTQGDLAARLQRNDPAGAEARLRHWLGVFGDRYYLQATRLGLPREEALLAQYYQWGQRFGVASVATNQACFRRPEEFEVHEIRVCIDAGTTVAAANRPRRHTPAFHLRTAEEMARLFPPTLLANSLAIAERCNLELELGRICLPDCPVPAGCTANEELVRLSRDGLEERLLALFPSAEARAEQAERYRERLEMELAVIQKMGFAGYFLIVSDFIRWAKKQDIPVGPGRGSGAGSLVAFALQITNIDPLPYDLLFERFLNPERVSMPDFDIDFCGIRRDEVIRYVSDTYGHDSVAQIATHGTMAAKAVIRDVARVQGMAYGDADRIAKMISKAIGVTLDDALGRSARVQAARTVPPDEDEMKRKEREKVLELESPELQREYAENEEVRSLLDHCLQLEGLTKSVGKHAAGVVIAPSALTDFSALYAEEAGKPAATQFDKDDIEKMGLVKFDFLGLKTLTIIDDTVKLLKRRGIDIGDINLIDLEDKKVYEAIASGQTTAVFQLESNGMKKLVRAMKPDNFEDIISLLALFRPGPLGSKLDVQFVECKHGQRAIIYPHPSLEPILKPTYGTMIYQEQIMQISQVLAGYTLGGADELRRAMGKKKKEEMARHREIFVAGAQKNGVAEDLARDIFAMMEKFAEYGFNKSHSAAYALLSYQTAWLKYYHPAEFMASVLTSEMEHTEKVVRNLDEARQLGLRVLPPSINGSHHAFGVNGDGAIVFGLGGVKGVGAAAVSLIVGERDRGGPFRSLEDFCARLDLKKLNRKTLETLIKSGCFDELEPNRGGLLEVLPQAMKLSEISHQNQQHRQEDMFGLFGGEEAGPASTLQIRPESAWTAAELSRQEKETLGLYLTSHPIAAVAAEVKALTGGYRLADLSADMAEWDEEKNHEVAIAGLIMDIYRGANKRTQKPLMDFTLDDGSDRHKVSLSGKWLEQFEALIREDEIIFLRGYCRFNSYFGRWQIQPTEIISIGQHKYELIKNLTLRIKHSSAIDYPLILQRLLVPAPGAEGCTIHLAIVADDVGLSGRLTLAHSFRINEALLAELQQLFGGENIALTY